MCDCLISRGPNVQSVCMHQLASFNWMANVNGSELVCFDTNYFMRTSDWIECRWKCDGIKYLTISILSAICYYVFRINHNNQNANIKHTHTQVTHRKGWIYYEWICIRIRNWRVCFLMFYNYVYANNGVATSIMS